MGRQIGFFQLQEDAVQFFDAFYPKGVVLFDSRGEIVEDYRSVCFPAVTHPVTKALTGNFFIGYRTTDFDKSLSKKYLYPSYWRYLIEFIPSRLSMGRADHYNDGRIYLSDEIYDRTELAALYQMLVRYIKKNYLYNRAMTAYIAPGFYKRLQEGSLVPCNADNPYML